MPETKEYTKVQAEQEFGTAYPRDLRPILERRLGHKNFSVTTKAFPGMVLITIFEEEAEECPDSSCS